MGYGYFYSLSNYYNSSFFFEGTIIVHFIITYLLFFSSLYCIVWKKFIVPYKCESMYVMMACCTCTSIIIHSEKNNDKRGLLIKY